MLHLFQTPRTMAVLSSSNFDMDRHSNWKRKLSGPIRFRAVIPARNQSGAVDLHLALAKESKNLANQIGQHRPRHRKQPEHGDNTPRHLRPQKFSSSVGPML